MTSFLTQRAEELRLLGWTDEGANRYDAISEDTNFQIDFSNIEILFSIGLIIFFVLILFFLIARNYFQKKESSILLIPESISEDINDKRFPEKDFDESNSLVVRTSQYSLDKSPLEQFIVFLKSRSVDTDKLIIIFLAIFTFALDALNTSWRLINNNFKETHNREDDEILNSLSLKSDKELRELFDGVEVVENLERERLIDLIKSNSKFLNRFYFKERRSELKRMKNSELKSLLVGVDKISRLNKSQLIERVLFIEYGDQS